VRKTLAACTEKLPPENCLLGPVQRVQRERGLAPR